LEKFGFLSLENLFLMENNEQNAKLIEGFTFL